MSIYKITFNSNFSDFDKCSIEFGYVKPQDYFKDNPDNTCLLVQERLNDLYIVVFYKTSKTLATHPWTKFSWLKQYTTWNKLSPIDWENKIKNFIKKY